MRIVCQQTILMEYLALIVIFEKHQSLKLMSAANYRWRFMGYEDPRSHALSHRFKKKWCTIVNIFLPIILTFVLGAQKNCIIELVLLSTHNKCFG